MEYESNFSPAFSLDDDIIDLTEPAHSHRVTPASQETRSLWATDSTSRRESEDGRDDVERQKEKRKEMLQEAKRKRVEDKEIEKRKKAVEKEEEKRKRREEKEAEKQKRERAKQLAKKKSKEECLKEMRVVLDLGLVSSQGGGEILAMLQSKSCHVEFDHLAVKQSVEWMRKTDSGAQLQESHVAVRLLAEDLGELVVKQQFYRFVKNIRDTHSEKNIIYILEGLQEFLRLQKLETNRAQRGGESRVILSKQDMDNVLVWLQVEVKSQVWQTASLQETAGTSSTAFAHSRRLHLQADHHHRLRPLQVRAFPPLTRRQESTFSGFCAESVNRNSQHTWLNQLMQISGVSYQIAKTVTSSYPTFHSLMKMYECEGMTEKAKENLLANLERVESTSASRKLGPSISRKIYMVFNEVDGTKLVQDL